MPEVEVWGGGCECWVTPESDWVSAASCGYGGGYEPGSQVEFNPDCPKHGDLTYPTAPGGDASTKKKSKPTPPTEPDPALF